jgi:hypothetical protein
MGLHHKPGDPIPVTSSIGLIRSREIEVLVTLGAFAWTFEGVTKFFRKMTQTTSYAGMVRDNPAPTPDTSYTVTPRVVVYEVPRGWSAQTRLSPSNDITEDLDGDGTTDVTPEEWTPPLGSVPTFEPTPTVTRTENSYTEVRNATGVWSGTQTFSEVYSEEITKEELINAALAKRDAAVFAGDDFAVIPGGGEVGSPIYSPQFIFNPESGSVTLKVVDYSLGTYTARPYVSFQELIGYSFDYGPTQTLSTGRTSALSDTITLPTGPFAQESFRDDSKHLFGGWFRVDPRVLFPDEESVTASISLFGLSGHKFVSESTGTIIEDGGYSILGTPFASGQAFYHSIGPVTTP